MSQKNERKKRKEKAGYSLQNTSICPLCIRLLKVTKDQHKLKNREKPVAVLSIIGEDKKYLPNETIKTQLKSGLIELMTTTYIWIIIEGRHTCIGQIVQEVIRGNTDKSQSRCIHKDEIAGNGNKNGIKLLQPHKGNLEVCIKEHLKIPLIVMLVGGDENSFEAALVNLKRSLPVLIHVYSVYETSYTLDRTIQDILFDLFCTDEDKRTDNMLHFVDLWNRPDIAEKEIFKLENSQVLEKLQDELGKPGSSLAKLFTNALKYNRVDLVKQVLEYILDMQLYKKFLDHSLKDLYETTGCIGGYNFRKLKEKTSKKNIVENINEAVIKILGNEDMKPFEEGAALYASSLAKRLAENASAEAFMDEQIALWESSRHYEDLAYSVMTELYLNDRKHARRLLVTEVKRYNSTTIFEITEKFTLMKFMGHAACQTKLNKIWKGRITGETSNLKAIVFAVTILPILKWDIVKLHKTGETAKNKGNQSVRSNTKEKENYTTCLPSTPNWMKKLYYFYNSPLIKFLFSVLTYITMLAIFSLFVLTDLHPMEEKFPSIYEYIVYVWAASTLAEEIRQAVAMNHFQGFELRQLTLNAMTWFSFWTLFEMLMYLMFITSVFFRLTLSAEYFYNARMMYAVTLGTFIINSMQFFLVSKHIGPKVIMIGRMMFDVIFFILIFAVFLFGFGVIYQATMYPNELPGLKLFQNLIYMPYWQLYGELFLEKFDEIEETDAENGKLAILEKDAVYSHFNSSARLRRHRAKNMDAEKDGFEASYEKVTDLSLQEQINVLSSDVDIIQKNQEETLKAVKQIMATKQNVLIVEVPRGVRS
ncbi:TRPM1 [Mytilus coruscus]|uniref:TRPM1 n=1 Tax=Mytilus coruscus TaxID=42192 RepID=A0A6J8BMI1_MYTCO|nr:TRPM1 [Mytilus coruscus]